MSLFRPQYTDKKTGLVKHAKKWWYEFSFAGRTIRESAKTTSKTVAKEAEKKRRRELEEGFNGIADAREQRILTVRQMAQDLLQDYKIRQPKSARFAEYAIGHVSRKLGELMAVDITDKTIIRYQIERLKEGAAPKTINEEVSFLLRLLPITQAGALRAILRKQKKLKLKVQTKAGKAYSEQLFAHRFAVEFDAVGIVDEPVEDAVGNGGIADLLMPMGNRHLRSKNQRSALIAIIADLQEVAALAVFQRSHGKIVEHQDIDSGEFP